MLDKNTCTLVSKVNTANTIVSDCPSNMVSIILNVAPTIEIIPVFRSSDLPPSCQFSCYSQFQDQYHVIALVLKLFGYFLSHPTMEGLEDLDEQLLLAKLEISCWKGQLIHAVSQLQFTNTLYALQSISLENQGSNFKVLLYFIFYICIGFHKYYNDTSTGQYNFTESRPEVSNF